MQAITVTYIPCTNTRPTRWKAECAAGKLIVSESSIDENQIHRAARMLIEKLDWKNSQHMMISRIKWIEGTTKDGVTVFVAYDPKRDFEVLRTDAPEEIEFTRIDNDVNGNGRYVVHFLNLLTRAEVDAPADFTLPSKYSEAIKRANTIGGRKYAAKSYGGGIVFTSSSLTELTNAISRVTGRNFINKG